MNKIAPISTPNKIETDGHCIICLSKPPNNPTTLNCNDIYCTECWDKYA